ncbi:phosphoribosylglycinamide formyltransferase [Natranaerofaba carboxydovora]|uniref:phosphoribosylglycinamide formyltransferase n=1 Tax=Natranaerofaba carboxydovora TaxID=2742683 RepID=UPI001F131AA2|nr:phosphoribosylglycinamide formyltransferase [Natranaerofaba carboxydovora]UMZ74537.1 Phosphoribosylglycinamide formyltransferase [Natranaerofaba carboxydovora]
MTDKTNKTDKSQGKKIAVLASGSGTNFQAIIDSVDTGYIPASIELLITDNAQAVALKRAKKANIDTRIFYPSRYQNREAMEREMIKELKDREVDYIILAGYMRLLTSIFVKEYKNKIVNVHPSLLPAFPGDNSVKEALDYGVKFTGCTVHFVDEGVDTGPILIQRPVKVFENDTADSLKGRIQKREWQLLPRAVRALVTGNLKRIDERKWIIINE